MVGEGNAQGRRDRVRDPNCVMFHLRCEAGAAFAGEPGLRVMRRAARWRNDLGGFGPSRCVSAAALAMSLHLHKFTYRANCEASLKPHNHARRRQSCNCQSPWVGLGSQRSEASTSRSMLAGACFRQATMQMFAAFTDDRVKASKRPAIRLIRRWRRPCWACSDSGACLH